MNLDKFPKLLTFQCWKASFKTEVCSCSGYPSEAMLWSKEVEMVDSVDDLETSQSTRGHRFPRTVRKESIWQSRRMNQMTDSLATDRLHDL